MIETIMALGYAGLAILYVSNRLGDRRRRYERERQRERTRTRERPRVPPMGEEADA